MKISMQLRNETKTCYRFECKLEDESIMTLYLKKKQVDEAGINPAKGIVITVEEGSK